MMMKRLIAFIALAFAVSTGYAATNNYNVGDNTSATISGGTISGVTSITTGAGGTINLLGATSGTATLQASSTGGSLNLSMGGGDFIVGTSAGATTGINLNAAATTAAAYLRFQSSGTNKWGAGRGPADLSDNFQIYNFGTSSSALAIDGTTNAATFVGAVTGTTLTGTTQFLMPSGTTNCSTVGAAFSSSTSTGFIYAADSGVTACGGGARAVFLGNDGSGNGQIKLPVGGSFGWTASNTGAAADLLLSRDAANTLALKNANSPQTFNHYGGNGGFMSVVAFNESLTIAAAATTDSTTTIPAGAQIIAVSVRVTTVIPTAATFTVTAATGGTVFNTAAVSVAANSTDAGTAAGGATYTSAGTKIRITPNLTPGTATGVVRINGYYRIVTPPTS